MAGLFLAREGIGEEGKLGSRATGYHPSPSFAASVVIPPVRIESSSSSLAEGQTLELNCLVTGQTHPKITWFKRGGPLPPNHQVQGERRSYFASLRRGWRSSTFRLPSSSLGMEGQQESQRPRRGRHCGEWLTYLSRAGLGHSPPHPAGLLCPLGRVRLPRQQPHRRPGGGVVGHYPG